MKQAARMQQQMDRVQADLAARTVEGTSGGGAVKVTARCDGTLSAVKIDPQALNPADVAMLEDMILSAANQALNQATEIKTAEMGKVTQGFRGDVGVLRRMIVNLVSNACKHSGGRSVSLDLRREVENPWLDARSIAAGKLSCTRHAELC